MLSYKIKIRLLLAITLIGIISVFFIQPIGQNTNYHVFADTHTVRSIPNCNNVLSNFPLIVFGMLGIIFIAAKERKTSQHSIHINNLVFFIGIFLTGIGSSYYHLHPTTATLVWDRLPMTITFMAFFSIIISEYIDWKIGKRLLFHLLFIGIISVLYWYKTELNGLGDLRFYILVQYLPLLLIPCILLLFKSETRPSRHYWIIMAVYLSAKVFELLDYQLFALTHVISGHSLKHLVVSLAPILYWLRLSNKKNNLKTKGHIISTENYKL